MSDPGHDRRTGVSFESVMFRGQHTEISFTEANERGDEVAMVRTMVINGPRHIPAEHAALLEALLDYIDAAHVALRNPPSRIPG